MAGADKAAGAGSVSCTSRAFCFAVGYGTATQFDGASWSAPVTVDGGRNVALAVSCVDPSFCVTVDDEGRGFSYNGKVWAAARSIDTSVAPWVYEAFGGAAFLFGLIFFIALVGRFGRSSPSDTNRGMTM